MGLFPVMFVVLLVLLLSMIYSVGGIGANWGTQATHPLPPDIVVRLLRDNGIQKVKLFDAEYDCLRALGKSGIEVMVGIPNDMLASLASNMKAAEKWVYKNVSAHISSSNVNIRYGAVGNEPFLATYNGSFLRTTLPALENIQAALIKAGLSSQVKVTVPLNGDVYESSNGLPSGGDFRAALIKAGLSSQVKVTVPLNGDVYESSNGLPSGGDFRADIHDFMIQIVKFLSDHGAPFTVNIYPFISLYTDSNFPVEYAFFDGSSSPVNDGGTNYNNMFDANHDTLVWALQKNGFGNLPIIVGEIGWPTDGDRNANAEYARRFNQGFINHISGGRGTPLRPGPIDAYLFGLIDEDAKSIQPGNFERHWGIFTYDGLPKYALNLGTKNGQLVRAKNVRYLDRKWCVLKSDANLSDPQVGLSVAYACERADCTSLGYQTSCGNLNVNANISHAFNSYYQRNNQLEPYYGGSEQMLCSIQKTLVLVVVSIFFLWTNL